MASYGTSVGVSAAARRHHAKLHKRGGSGSSTSLPGPPSSSLKNSTDTFTTPFATYEEPSNHYVAATPPLVSTPRLKPYTRKMSKDDQGQLDLSRSTAENEKLAGLGIDGTRTAADVSFTHSSRRQTSHSRTISGGSQVSNGSGPKAAQPFVHPMRQTPRPYTPPLGPSYASSLNAEEANESSDVLDDDFKLGHGFRTRRSVSISSTPQISPTPLSQSHIASDLGLVPKHTSPSLTNLSIKSNKSGSRSRNATNCSAENATTPSSRTSLDKAFSFVSRKSDLEPQSRDERIRAARRKFEEKEAGKSRKAEKGSVKRQQNDRSKKIVRKEERRPDRPPTSDHNKKAGHRERAKRDSMNEKLATRPYEEYRESNEASLPIQGRAAGSSEKTPRTQEYRAKPAQGGFKKFEAWFRTRMLTCGEER